MWVITGGCQGSKRPKTDRSRAWKLVSGLESAAERPLTAKNCLVDVPAVVLRRVDSLIVDEVVLHRGGAVTEGWDVAEGFVLEHSGADSLGELLDLFLNVGEEGVGTPAADEHNCVDLFLG